MQKRKVDIAIISDVHLGTYSCHSTELLNYLNHIDPKVLILNGDFINIWQLRKGNFPKDHFKIIHRILRMTEQNTKVYYITGNHDDELRKYTAFSSGKIHLRNKLLLQLNGKKHWIFHGDVFDLLMEYSPILTRFGGKGYELLISMNRMINNFRTKLGKPHRSFATKIKSRVRKAVKYISSFESTAIRLAAEKKYDYVICGHIHKPAMYSVIENDHKVTYLNSGDWVENLTALEYNYNKWRLYTYDESDYVYRNRKLNIRKRDPKPKSRNISQQLIQNILNENPETVF